jgi:hypothetical protein
VSAITLGEAPRNLPRSALAVFLGLVVIFALSLGTDQVLHELQVYPPWGEPMWDPGLNLLALAYRVVYGVAGSWLTALLAPRHPMRHAMTLAAVGFVLSTAGAVGAVMMGDLGPSWYPITLALTALPCGWMGGLLHRAWLPGRRRMGRATLS